MMSFKDWFYKEAMTSTSCIAGFARMTLPLQVRGFGLMLDSDKKKKAKPKKS